MHRRQIHRRPHLRRLPANRRRSTDPEPLFGCHYTKVPAQGRLVEEFLTGSYYADATNTVASIQNFVIHLFHIYKQFRLEVDVKTNQIAPVIT